MLIQIHTKALQSFYHQISQTKQPTNTAVITIIKNTLSTGFPIKRIFYPTQQSRIIFRSLPRSTMGIHGSAIFRQARSMVHRLLRSLCHFRWQSAHLPGRSHVVPAEKHDTPLEYPFYKVPEQKEVEIKDGVTKEKVKKMFPGYILVEMVMTDEAWYIVRNTPGVTGFIGSSGKGAKPTPLQPYEVDKILNNMGMSRIDVDNDLEVGSKVKIVAGPFNGMYGKIEEIDLPNQKINLTVDLFGQETSVEVELNQIEKA